MSIRHIILFIFLTTLLIVLAYALLEMIDRHSGVLAIVSLAMMIVADIFLMKGFFIRYMKSDGLHKH